MMRRLLEPLPALAAALLALLLAVLYIDHGWDVPIAVAGGLFLLTSVVFLVGRRMLATSPYVGGLLMETALLLVMFAAAFAGAVLVWLAIEKAPKEGASVREKEVFTAMSAAVTAYLGSLIIEPEGEIWNPIKSTVKSTFADSFTSRSTPLEKDAREAVQEEHYGAQAPAHADEVVSGWGWDARRLRTRHIQDQLNA